MPSPTENNPMYSFINNLINNNAYSCTLTSKTLTKQKHKYTGCSGLVPSSLSILSLSRAEGVPNHTYCANTTGNTATGLECGLDHQSPKL
ncbi:hypothetical protein Hanom_Chr14g01317701 [Helianthus anomalus]